MGYQFVTLKREGRIATVLLNRPPTNPLSGAFGRELFDAFTEVGRMIASVLTGGDVPPGTKRTEQELLDMEREAFLSLCGEEKTQARIQFMQMKGKPLGN